MRRRWRAEKKEVFRGAVHSPSFNGTEYDSHQEPIKWSLHLPYLISPMGSYSHYIRVRFKIPFYLLRRFLGFVMLYSWVIKTLNKSQEHIRDFPFNFRCGEVTAYCAGSNQRNDKNSIPSDVSVSKRMPDSPPYLSSLSGVPIPLPRFNPLPLNGLYSQ